MKRGGACRWLVQGRLGQVGQLRVAACSPDPGEGCGVMETGRSHTHSFLLRGALRISFPRTGIILVCLPYKTNKISSWGACPVILPNLNHFPRAPPLNGNHISAHEHLGTHSEHMQTLVSTIWKCEHRGKRGLCTV